MSNTTAIRTVTPFMRRVLQLASFLVLGAGIQLFILGEHTEKFFAWTIDPPLTAAALGAAYLASVWVEWRAAQAGSWAEARVAVPGVLLFTTLTNVPIMQNLGAYHWGRPAAWVWVAVYALVPFIMGYALREQLKVPGKDPEAGPALPLWLRGLLALHTAFFVLYGVAMMAAPEAAGALWPWDLNPSQDLYAGLTEPYFGCWLLGLGVVAGQSVWENDLRRLRDAFPTYALLGLLLGIATLRYSGQFDFGGPSAWVWLAMVLTILLAGAVGTLLSTQAGVNPITTKPLDRSPAKPARIVWDIVTPASPEAAWDVFADSDRYNWAADVHPTYRDQLHPDGEVRRSGSLRVGPIPLQWLESPYQYNAPNWFRVERRYYDGLASHQVLHGRLKPDSEGTRLRYVMEIFPRPGVPRALIQKMTERMMKPQMSRAFDAMKALLQEQAGSRYDPAPPALGEVQADRLLTASKRIEPPDLAGRLKELIETAPLPEQDRIRPLLQARRWRMDGTRTTLGFLRAVEEGILTLRWELLCPSCFSPKKTLERLGSLEGQVHCASCNIHYDASFPDAVGVSFRPAPQIRDFTVEAHCVGSPRRTPHFVARKRVAQGETLELELELSPGQYRVRGWPVSGTGSLDIRPHDGKAPLLTHIELRLTAEGVQPPLLRAAPGPVKISVKNELPRDFDLLVERRQRPPDVLTAGRLLELPGARALLPAELVAPELQVESLRSVVVAAQSLVGGDGLADLGRALQIAGARRVHVGNDALVSLWQDADQALAAVRSLADRPHVVIAITTGVVLEVGEGEKLVPSGSVVDHCLALLGAAVPGEAAVPAERSADLEEALVSAGLPPEESSFSIDDLPEFALVPLV